MKIEINSKFEVGEQVLNKDLPIPLECKIIKIKLIDNKNDKYLFKYLVEYENETREWVLGNKLGEIDND